MNNNQSSLKQTQILDNANSTTENYSIYLENKNEIIENARLLCPIVAAQSQAFPVILPQRIPSVCLSSSAAFGSHLDMEKGTKLSFLSLTAFAIDDVADGAVGAYTNEQIEDWLTIYDQIIKSGVRDDQDPDLQEQLVGIDTSQPGGQVAEALVKSCQGMKAFPCTKIYYALFAKYMSLCLEAMRLELHWQQNLVKEKVYPTYEQYLDNGKVSIGMPAILAGLLMIIAQPRELTNFDHPHFSSLEQLLDELLLNYGAGIRLQNDLRSFKREQLEGKPNSISILMSSQKLSEKEAYAQVSQQADTYLEQANLLLSLLPENLQIWGECTKRLSRFANDFYKISDFHNFSQEMLDQIK